MSIVRHLRSIGLVFLVSLLMGGVALAQQPAPQRIQPAAMDRPFPTHAYKNLNTAAGGAANIDLATYVGKSPLLLYYWIPGHARSDAVLQQLQEVLADVGSESKLKLLVVTLPKPGLEATLIAERSKAQGVTVPVLDDSEFRIGQQLRVQSVPNLTLIDGQGLLRLANGASLKQVIGYKLTVESAIRRLAESGKLGTYGYLDRYFPVEELVGQRAPDFKAPLISTKVEQSWSSMIQKEKVNLLVFWSVDCPHCRKTLPEINAWFKADGEGFNVVSCAFVANDAVQTKTREYCALNKLAFPTLVDRDQKIGALYNVTSTPTILVVRGDGIVDSVLLNADENFSLKMREIRERLL